MIHISIHQFEFLSQMLFALPELSLWLRNNYLELFGAVSGLLYIYLEIKQKNIMWVVGFFTSLAYIFVFFLSKFYADMALNVYYVIISAYGWYCWHYAPTQSGASVTARTINRIHLPLGIILGVITAILFFTIGYVLVHFTDSPIPYYDALTTSLSIVATWMLARKILEHWILWIFINFFSTILYFWRGLYPTTILFFVYGVMSIVGWIKWKQSFNPNAE